MASSSLLDVVFVLTISGFIMLVSFCLCHCVVDAQQLAPAPAVDSGGGHHEKKSSSPPAASYYGGPPGFGQGFGDEFGGWQQQQQQQQQLLQQQQAPPSTVPREFFDKRKYVLFQASELGNPNRKVAVINDWTSASPNNWFARQQAAKTWGVPETMRGVWWMSGNPMGTLVSNAWCVWDGQKRTMQLKVAGPSWIFAATNEGLNSMKASERSDLHYNMKFENPQFTKAHLEPVFGKRPTVFSRLMDQILNYKLEYKPGPNGEPGWKRVSGGRLFRPQGGNYDMIQVLDRYGNTVPRGYQAMVRDVAEKKKGNGWLVYKCEKQGCASEIDVLVRNMGDNATVDDAEVMTNSYAAHGTRPNIVVEATTRTPSSSSGGGSESIPSCLNNPTIVCTDSSTNTKSSWCSSGSMSFRDLDGRTYYGSVTNRTDDETLVSYTNGDKQKCTKQRSSELFTERWLCYFSNDSDLDTKHDATCRRASAANDAEGAAGLDQCRLPEDQRSGWVNGDLSGVGIGGTNKAIRTCLDNGCSCEHRNPMLPGRTCIATPYGQEPTCE